MSNVYYSAEIDKVLDAAKNIIVVATNKENVLSGWVQYERTAFTNEKRSGQKDGIIITLIDENMPLAELPILLRQFEVIPFSNFENVSKYLRQHRTIAEASAVESPIRQETIGFPAHFFARAHNFKPPGRACQPEADSPMRT